VTSLVVPRTIGHPTHSGNHKIRIVNADNQASKTRLRITTSIDIVLASGGALAGSAGDLNAIAGAGAGGAANVGGASGGEADIGGASGGLAGGTGGAPPTQPLNLGILPDYDNAKSATNGASQASSRALESCPFSRAII
jgi:hypothetical protein